MATVEVVVSGKAYNACLDPGCSNVPADEGWPGATFRPRGRGLQAVYRVTELQARAMRDHLLDVGEGFVNGDDDYTRAEGRACLAAARAIEKVLQW